MSRSVTNFRRRLPRQKASFSLGLRTSAKDVFYRNIFGDDLKLITKYSLETTCQCWAAVAESYLGKRRILVTTDLMCAWSFCARSQCHRKHIDFWARDDGLLSRRTPSELWSIQVTTSHTTPQEVVSNGSIPALRRVSCDQLV
jgi:hypothetical protein